MYVQYIIYVRTRACAHTYTEYIMSGVVFASHNINGGTSRLKKTNKKKKNTKKFGEKFGEKIAEKIFAEILRENHS